MCLLALWLGVWLCPWCHTKRPFHSKIPPKVLIFPKISTLWPLFLVLLLCSLAPDDDAVYRVDGVHRVLDKHQSAQHFALGHNHCPQHHVQYIAGQPEEPLLPEGQGHQYLSYDKYGGHKTIFEWLRGVGVVAQNVPQNNHTKGNHQGADRNKTR